MGRGGKWWDGVGRGGKGWEGWGVTTHCSLLTAHYSPLTTHCSLLTTHYSPLTTHLGLGRAPRLDLGAAQHEACDPGPDQREGNGHPDTRPDAGDVPVVNSKW